MVNHIGQVGHAFMTLVEDVGVCGTGGGVDGVNSALPAGGRVSRGVKLEGGRG